MMKNLKKMMEALRQLLKKGENPLKKRNLNHQLRCKRIFGRFRSKKNGKHSFSYI